MRKTISEQANSICTNAAGDLFKSQFVLLYPAGIPGSHGGVAALLAGPNVGFLANLANQHVTISPGLKPCINSDCAADGHLDLRRHASPDAPMRIVQ